MDLWRTQNFYGHSAISAGSFVPAHSGVSVTSENIEVNNVNQLMISSYIDADNQKLVTVIINNGNIDSSVSIHTKGGQVISWQPYITGPNEGEDVEATFNNKWARTSS